MPTNKDFKRLVRQRMAETSERYTEALAALNTGSGALPLAPDRDTRTAHDVGRRWVELLGHPEHNQGAFRMLQALPADRLRALAIAGTTHPDARVRRRSCQLLDDLALTSESIAALERCSSDADPRVRAAALHTLACERCKPDGVCLDQRAIAERAAADPSARVRRGVAMTLSWNTNQSDDWAVAMATRLLADPSAEIRLYARAALDRIDRQRRSDSDRLALPEPLRRKTERHAGKWVAVVDGTIAAVSPTPSWRRRHPDAQLYFVSATASERAPTRATPSAR